MTFVIALLVLAGSSEKYPVAAPLVINGHLVLADYQKHSSRELPTPGLIPKSADLSRDSRRIVFAASVEGAAGAPSRLYVLDLADGKITKLDTGLDGEHSTPRFTHDGSAVLFSAPDRPNSSPANPTRARLISLGGKITPIPSVAGDEKVCEFAPVPKGGETAIVATNCFVGFELRAKNLKQPANRKLEEIDAPTVETASSFDGKKLVYTVVEGAGTRVMLRLDERPAKPLALLKTHDPIQPHFICPRDLMVLVGGEAIVLNTDTGVATKVMEEGKP